MVNSMQGAILDPKSPPCKLDISPLYMPQCQYQPAYIITSISHPWPRATEKYASQGSHGFMGLGRHHGGLGRHNLWPLGGTFQCPSANIPYLLNFKSLVLSHHLEEAPVVHQPDPVHLDEVWQPQHQLSHGSYGLHTKFHIFRSCTGLVLSILIED